MSQPPLPGPLGFRAWAGLIVVLHLGLGLLLWEPTLFEGGDNAGYMILGEALRSGEGYRDLYLPGEPLHAKYPPFYPALLGILGWLGGVQLFKLLSLAFTTGAVALTARLGREMAGTVPALAAAAVLALNPVLLEYAHWILSEAPFVFLVLLALALLPAESGRVHAAGLAAAAAAFLTRTAGLPLLIAAAAVPLLRRRGRRAGLAAGVGAATAGGWALYQGLADPGQPGYLRQLVLADPYDPAAGTAGPADLLQRAAENLWSYAGSVLPGSLTGAAPTSEAASAVPVLLGLAVSGLALAGWILRARRRIGYAELFALLYAGLIVVWPQVWTDRRFLLPLLPLILLYAAHAAGEAAARAFGRRGSGAGTAGGPENGGGKRVEPSLHPTPGAAGALGLGLLLAVPGLADAAARIPDRIACVARYRAGDPCVVPELASFYAAARWAREHTEPDAVIANRKPTLFYWHSRRKGDVYRYSSEPALVLRSLEAMGATHVVVDRLSATTVRYLLPAIRAHRDRFEIVYPGGEPPTPILRFRPAPDMALSRP